MCTRLHYHTLGYLHVGGDAVRAVQCPDDFSKVSGQSHHLYVCPSPDGDLRLIPEYMDVIHLSLGTVNYKL